MNFISKLFAHLTHPYNRPELAGNLTLWFFAFLYLSLSIVTTRTNNVRSQETYENSLTSFVSIALGSKH